MPNNSKGYIPTEEIKIPPFYSLPPPIIKSINWIFNFLFPWWIIYIGLAYISCYYLTPSLIQMSELSVNWIFLILIKNIFFLTIFAGGIHWWLYIRKNQLVEFKYYSSWPNENSKKFLFSNQVKDNMFWSIVCGCPIWTIYEAAAFWMQASGYTQVISWNANPLYLSLCVLLMPFLGAVHFYIIHRILHIPIIYRTAHQLHHRNVNTGPWSGISMHPLEHVLYFSVIGFWFIIPSDPFVITITGIWFGIGPAQTHAGFNKLLLFKSKTIELADHFHHLHHKHFELNYGNIWVPMDPIFKSFYNGKVSPKKTNIENRMK